MNLFDLFFRIGAKDEASGVIERLTAGFRNFAQFAGVAIVTAATALTTFAVSSVKTGEKFDKAMSQVQATMLKTNEEFANEIGTAQLATGEFTGNLREFAQVLGETTKFSATEAAEALNYMALAGYDAQESMNMLPNVMNLASAGDMALARASDMVTDAQTALGLSSQETATMVDQMAKTASKSNTSVEQLGDAILTIGGTAQFMAGGTERLNTVLGILADNGIKGSEAGTHLRNILLKLSSPTNEGQKALKKLGVEVFDSGGKMKDMQVIIQDLNKAMDGMSDDSKMKYISQIFNTQDITSVNALLGTTAERWEELGSAIEDSSGAAEEMAAIQMDNLAGDVTLFKSALEGAQIAVSDVLTPTIREFVQFGTDGVSRLTQAFKEKGLSGAMEEFGNILCEGVSMVIEKLPMMVDSAIELVTAFAGGLVENRDVILNAFKDIISLLVQKAQENLPGIATEFFNVFNGIIGTITEIIPELANAFAAIAPEIAATLSTQLPIMIDGFVTLLLAVVDAIPIVINAIIPQIPIIVDSIVGALLSALPKLIQGAVKLFMALVSAIPAVIEILVPEIPKIVETVSAALLEALPLLLESAISLFMALVDAIPMVMEALIPQIPTIIETISSTLLELFPMLLEGAISLFMAIVEALPTIIDLLIEQLPIIIDTIVSTLVGSLPVLLQGAVTLFMALIQALPTIISLLKTKLPQIITTITNTLISNLPLIMQASVQLLTGIIEAIPQIIVMLVKEAPNITKSLAESIKSGISQIVSVGANLVSGLWEGITGKASWLAQKVVGWAKSIVGSIKETLGIASPSKVLRDQVGKWLPMGLEEGFEDEFPKVESNISKSINSMIDGLEVGAINMNGNANLTSDKNARYNKAVELDRIINLYIDKDTLVASTAVENDRMLGRMTELKMRYEMA